MVVHVNTSQGGFRFDPNIEALSTGFLLGFSFVVGIGVVVAICYVFVVILTISIALNLYVDAGDTEPRRIERGFLRFLLLLLLLLRG